MLKVKGEEDAALLAPKGCPKPGDDCCCPNMDPPVPKEEVVAPNAGVLEPNRLGVDDPPKTLAADDWPNPAPKDVLPNGAEACKLAHSGVTCTCICHRPPRPFAQVEEGTDSDLLPKVLHSVECCDVFTWPNAGVEAAPKAGVAVEPKAGVLEPKPKPPEAGEEDPPNSEGADAAPNAGVDAAPNAGLLAWPKGALVCGCPKSPPEVCPKPPAGEATPVFPLQPACRSQSSIGTALSLLLTNEGRKALHNTLAVCPCWVRNSATVSRTINLQVE